MGTKANLMIQRIDRCLADPDLVDLVGALTEIRQAIVASGVVRPDQIDAIHAAEARRGAW